MSTPSRKPINTRDIVTLAILSSLGGALSTFVGYLGNLVNLALGVPFGAGQFMAGLHVYWLVLIRVAVPKKGAGTFGGLLKGMVEMFTGSTHGIVIVLISLVQGLLIDIFAMIGQTPEEGNTVSRIVWWIGAGISSISNVIIFQIIYFSGVPFLYIFVIIVLAFCSGVIFAGYFAWETLEFLNETQMLAYNFSSIRESRTTKRRDILRRNIPAVIMVLFLIIGSAFYFVFIAQVGADPYSCQVTGLVDNPYTFQPTLFEDERVTIEAELIGAYTHLPPANYTGVLMSTILELAEPKAEATGLRVIARDGYTIPFNLTLVMNDDHFLLTETTDGLWLIAGEYDGSQWVRQVVTLEVY